MNPARLIIHHTSYRECNLATHVISYVIVQHADDGRSLVVGNVVENLVNFIRMADGDFDGMRVLQTVEVQGRCRSVCDELGPDFELGEQVIDTKRFHERSVTFVQPQMSPPFLSKLIRVKIQSTRFFETNFIPS